MSPTAPAFRTGKTMAPRTYLVPIVRKIIANCEFPEEFAVTFQHYTADREPDGWFHPSSHPTMGERRLYYYLAHPEAWQPQPFPYQARMAVMMGSATHDIVEHALVHRGHLLEPVGTCVCCGKPHGKGPGECPEWGVRDDRLGRRGHMDGILTLDDWGSGVFDLKTCSPTVLRGVTDHDLELFKAKWPKYYGQAQEYMAMSGYQQTMILFVGMSMGWELKEFTIPRDDAYIVRLEAKYQGVRAAVAARIPPPLHCCTGGAAAKECGATMCSVKKVYS